MIKKILIAVTALVCLCSCNINIDSSTTESDLNSQLVREFGETTATQESSSAVDSSSQAQTTTSVTDINSSQTESSENI